MSSLKGDVALVTGAGTGIGRSVALKMADSGAVVVLAGRREEPLAKVVEEIGVRGGEAWYRSADMEDAASIAALTDAALERHGRVDIVVHNAGHSSRVRSARWIGLGEWDSVMSVNVTGPMLLNQRLLPAMIEAERGTVILIASMAALRPGPMAGTAYGAAKAAARNYMAGLAAELRGKGIRSTTIHPGEVDTPILANRPLVPDDEARRDMMQADDIADAVLLAATLPHRTVIEEMTMMPTRIRDMSADIAAARQLGAPDSATSGESS